MWRLQDSSESDDSTAVIALEFRGMTLKFKKAQTLQEDIGEAGGVIASESFTVTIPPGAIVGRTLRTGFTVYEYQPKESENADHDAEVTDMIVLHPCGTKFAKKVEIRMKFYDCFQSETCLLYEGPKDGIFSGTFFVDRSAFTSSTIALDVGMTASLSPSSIDISTKHFCKLFACLFGCAGHCYRAMAFGRWAKGDSPHSATIDLHFTSSKLLYVDYVDRCNKGFPLLLNCNVTIFYSPPKLFCVFQSDPVYLPIELEVVAISPGWKLISTPPKNIHKQELTQAKKSPSKYCSRSFTLKREDTYAEDPWLEVQLTGGKKTDCLLTLKEYTSSPAVRTRENFVYHIFVLG